MVTTWKWLKQYLQEAIGGSVGKDSHAGNLYVAGAGQLPASVRNMGGNILDDETAEAEHQLQARSQAACCLVFGDNGTVLAVSRKDDPNAFGLPGGKVDPGETPKEAAARELMEETGLEATSLEQVFVRRELDGYITTTFVCRVTGTIRTSEKGVVKYVKPQTLFNGPFGEYNKQLWAKLDLSMT